MPMTRLLEDGSFDPEAISILVRAFNEMWLSYECGLLQKLRGPPDWLPNSLTVSRSSMRKSFAPLLSQSFEVEPPHASG